MLAFAKLCLNSLWGRFAMRTDRVMTKFITDPLQFYKRINGADTEMHDLCLLNDNLVEVVFKRKPPPQVHYVTQYLENSILFRNTVFVFPKL